MRRAAEPSCENLPGVRAVAERLILAADGNRNRSASSSWWIVRSARDANPNRAAIQILSRVAAFSLASCAERPIHHKEFAVARKILDDRFNGATGARCCYCGIGEDSPDK